MTDIIPLGFAIDTAGLARAKAAAAEATAEIGKLGAATDSLTAKSTTAAGAATKEAAAQDRVAVAGKKAADAKRQAGDAAQTASARFQATAAAAAAMAERVAAATQQTQLMAAGLGAGPGGVVTATTGATRGLAAFAAGLGRIGAGVAALTGGVTALGAAYAGLTIYLAGAQDRLDQLQGRLANAFGGDRGFADQLLRQLQGQSQQTGLPFGATADSFLRLARTREDIGATSREIMLLTELVQKLGVVSGASAGEVGSGMLQLSQALAAGRLNGDELRSIMENMPALAKAIADGLGVSVGQLRAMGAEGQLTSDKVFKALLGQTEAIRKEFEQLPETLERSTQRLSDAWDRLLGTIGRRMQSSQTAQGFTNYISKRVNEFADELSDDPQSRLRKAQKEYNYYQNRIENNPVSFINNLGNNQSRDYYKQQIEDIGELIRQEQRLAASRAATEEATAVPSAAISRAKALADEILKVASAQKEAETQTRILEAGIAALEAQMESMPTEHAAAQLNILRNALASIQSQAAAAQNALAVFQAQTEAMKSVRISFGADFIDYGREVQELQKRATESGRPTTEAEAREKVTQRRLEEARAAADREASDMQRMDRLIAAGNKGREAMARQRAEDNFRLKLSPDAGAEGDAMVKEAGARAVEKLRREDALRKIEERNSPSRGDVTARLRQDIALLQRSAGLDKAGRDAAKFEADLARELKDIPAGMKREYEKLARLKRDLEGQYGENGAETIIRDAKTRVEDTRRLADAERLVGVERQIALEMLKTEQQLRERGVVLTDEQRTQLRGVIEEQAKLNEAIENQKAAAAEMTRIWQRAGDGIQDALVDAFDNVLEHGKAGFSSFGDSIKKLGRSLLSQAFAAATRPAFNWIFGGGGGSGGGGGGLFGSLLGGLGSLFGGGGSLARAHSGELIGYDHASIPRMHGGGMVGTLAYDERLRVLQTGERVVSRMDNGRMVAAIEAMARRSEAAAPQVVAGATTIEQRFDFRGVDPSMRSYVESRLAAVARETEAAAVAKVGRTAQLNPGYLGR